MTLSYRVDTVTDHSGTPVKIRGTGVTCLVGANNAGKSQLLKDLLAHAKLGDSARLIVLSTVTHLISSGTREEELAALARNAVRSEDGIPSSSYVLWPSQNHVDPEHLHESLLQISSAANSGLGYVSELFVRRVSAGSLTTYASGELRAEWSPDQTPNWPVRAVHGNGELERELSDLMTRYFSMPVVMDRFSLPPQLRAGTVMAPAPPADAVTLEYSKAIQELPPLAEQGDGFRSFAGLALVVLALSPQVLLLDEPESFLHPGQARAIGRWLADEATARNMQVVVATHDKDFLIGLLSARDSSTVDVIRVARTADGSALRTVSAENLVRYRSDPVLRYSNTLQGLFHEHVVICEGDGDCRFFSAALEEIAFECDMPQISDNTLFVSSNGKNGIAKTVRILAELGVSTSVIADFDVLNNESTLRSIVASLDADWSPELDAAFRSMSKHLKPNAVDFWRSVKNGGLAKVPHGQQTKDFKALITMLARKRLYIIPVGELEDFYRDEGKGSAWIGAALAAGAHKTTEVRNLVGGIFADLQVVG